MSALARFAIVSLIFSTATTAIAQDVNFAGKTNSVYAATGGSSRFARKLAMPISKRHTAEPTIIVNEFPGAGALISANYIYEAATKDGREIAAVDGSIATVQLY